MDEWPVEDDERTKDEASKKKWARTGPELDVAGLVDGPAGKGSEPPSPALPPRPRGMETRESPPTTLLAATLLPRVNLLIGLNLLTVSLLISTYLLVTFVIVTNLFVALTIEIDLFTWTF